MSADVITSIVTPAASYNLVTLAQVKLELGIPSNDTTDDQYLNQKITSISALVSKYCNRPFVTETYQDIYLPDRGIEPFHSIGRFRPLQLTNWPVQSISSIVVAPGPTSASNETLTEGVDFVLNNRPGQVIRYSETTGLPCSWQPYPTTIVYVAGYATIPADLVDQLLALIAGKYQTKGINPMTKRTNQPGGIGEIEYWVPNSPQGAFPPSVQEVLDLYRVPVNS